MLIRPANPADVQAMFDVRVAVVDNPATYDTLAHLGITPGTIGAQLERGKYYGWVAELQGRVVGFALIDPVDCYLFALFVHPDAQRHGLGTRLLAVATDFCFTRGCKRLWLTTDGRSPAAAFYKRRGWHRAGLQPNGETRFELTRPLKTPAKDAR